MPKQPAITEFAKENFKAGVEGKASKAFLLFDVANLIQGENKLRAIKNIIRDLLFSIPLLQGLWVGAFLGMSKGVRSLVKDTGSLEQILKKLSQIQALRSSFTPLVGGAEAAKKKVAELVNFAASKNLGLEDVGEGAKNLMVRTRGAYSSAEALDQVNDVAKSTGNSFTGLAGVIGEFSSKLRSGDSIAGVVEQMREMGVVSDATAAQLDNLQENGASAAQVFGALTGSFAQFSGGAKQAADDIDSVNMAYENAAKNLQEKFASPFVESDIQNTKNMTDAMNAIAPAVGRVAGTLAIITQGLSTVKSSLLSSVAGSQEFRKALEVVIRVGSIAFTAFAAWQSVLLAKWFLTAANAATGFGQALLQASPKFAVPTLEKMGGALTNLAGKIGLGEKALAAFGVAGRVAFGAAGIGLIIGVVGTLVGIFLQWRNAVKQQEEELRKFAQANRESNEALKKQIAAVVTLADKHDVLTKALDEQRAAQEALNKAREKDPGFFGGNAKKKEVEEAQRALDAATKSVAEAQKAPTDLTPTGQQNLRRKAAEQLQKEEADFQNKLQLAPAEKQPKLLEEHAKKLSDQAAQGKKSAEERAKIEQQQADADDKAAVSANDLKLVKDQIAVTEKQTASFRATRGSGQALRDVEPEELQKHIKDEAKLNELYQKRDDLILKNNAAQQSARSVGEKAAQGTAPQLEAEIRKLQRDLPTITNPAVKAVGERKLEDLQIKAARQRQLEEEATAKDLQALQDRNQAKQIQREVDLSRLKVSTELEIANLKEEGFARTEKEIAARLKYLAEEAKVERAKGGDANRELLDRNAAQTAELQHQRRLAAQQKAITVTGVNLELAQQQAEIKHDSVQRRNLKDLSIFTEKFNELLGQGFEVPEAGKLAKQFSANALTLNQDKTQTALAGAIVADSLTKIGGGGGVYAPGSNDMVSLLQRQLDLQQAEVDYLKEIAEKENGIN